MNIPQGKGQDHHSLYLTDRWGIPLAMSEPVAGDHNDFFDFGVQFEVVTTTLEDTDISKGVVPKC